MPEHVVGKRPRRERLADELLLIGRAGNKVLRPALDQLARSISD